MICHAVFEYGVLPAFLAALGRHVLARHRVLNGSTSPKPRPEPSFIRAYWLGCAAFPLVCLALLSLAMLPGRIP
ncbi:hypothetical protein OG285_32185 [Streptomyces sp. NBC_01471]|uniref:hypothetical protein n=1 Tax=Streptomyces sp. NBC_01471 TaxID=2903879 RepID=UPI0032455151